MVTVKRYHIELKDSLQQHYGAQKIGKALKIGYYFDRI